MDHIQLLLILLAFSSVELNINPQGLPEKHSSTKNETHQEHNGSDQSSNDVPLIHLVQSASETQELKTKLTNNNSIVTNNSTSNHTLISNVQVKPKVNKALEDKPRDNPTELESGAIERAILVFVGVSFFFILYVGLQTYRRKRLDKSRVMIKKYGVRTSRTDIEMEPLPLSDDDEDDTIFDLTASKGISH